jgi:protein SCO1/2
MDMKAGVTWRWLVTAAALPLVIAAPARAFPPHPGSVQRTPPAADVMPEELKNVGVTERTGQRLPLNLTFKDERGNTVRLGDYFNRGRPVLLQLAYYECPQPCGLVSQGMMDAARAVELKIGTDLDIVIVSIDPREQPGLAYRKKQSYVGATGRPAEAGGWHLLTGEEQNIQQLAAAVGFQYKWVESVRQFAHPAVLMVIMPDGRVSRYLYGIKYDPQAVRLSLVEAADGKVGSALDRFKLLTCLTYDGTTGMYTVAVTRLMRLGGALTVLVVGGGLALLLLRERRKAWRERAIDSPGFPVQVN